MSLAGLYHYFSSKEELLFLIQLHTFEAILEGLKRKLDGVVDPEQRLRVMVLNHLEHFLSRMDDLKVCARELESLSGEHYDRVRALRQQYLRVTLQIVESIGTTAGASRVRPRLATLYLFGMLNWIYMWYPAEEGSAGRDPGGPADHAVSRRLSATNRERTREGRTGVMFDQFVEWEKEPPRLRPRMEGANGRKGPRLLLHLRAGGDPLRGRGPAGEDPGQSRAPGRDGAAHLRHVLPLLPGLSGAGTEGTLRLPRRHHDRAELPAHPAGVHQLAEARPRRVLVLPADAARRAEQAGGPYLTGEYESFRHSIEEWTGKKITDESSRRSIESTTPTGAS